jgi:hypothetical protein
VSAQAGEPSELPPRTPLDFGLLFICVACVGLALLDALCGLPILGDHAKARADEGQPLAAYFMGIAAALAVLPRIRRVKFGDVEIEALQEGLQSLRKDLKVVVQSRPEAGGTASSRVVSAPQTGPVERGAPPQAEASAQKPLAEARREFLRDPDWDSDPNKGRFGGLSTDNGRELVCSARPVSGPKSTVCRIRLTVRPLPGQPKLEGLVRLFLHPTFGTHAVQDLIVGEDGTATDEILAAGAFTVGVEADGGRTRLEYDLKRVPGATQAFRRN